MTTSLLFYDSDKQFIIYKYYEYAMNNLRDPLCPTDRDNVYRTNKRNSNKYLPPYPYDGNENILMNIYLSSDEAYATIAKTLLLQYEVNQHDTDPYDIMIKSLGISQIKMFADGHMERALNLPTFPERNEPSILSLVRQIDAHYAPVLLEFFASKDGILLKPQVEQLRKNKEIMSVDNSSSHQLIQSRNIEESKMDKGQTFPAKHTIIHNEKNTSKMHHIMSETTTGTVENEKVKDLQLKDTFERIFETETDFTQINEDSERNEYLSIDQNGSNQSSDKRASKLRREILGEIAQIKDLIKNTDSDIEKKRYKSHVNELIDELDRHTTNITSGYPSRLDHMNKSPGEDPKRHRVIVSRTQTDEIENSFVETVNNRSITKVETGTLATKSIDENMVKSRGYIHINDVEKGFQYVTMTAHENMKNGFLFQAKYRQQYFTVRVPKGGVKKGAIFSSPMLHPSGGKTKIIEFESLLDRMEIPQGRWRDKFFHCFNDHLLHMSCFCPNAAVSQTRTRMHFHDSGEIVHKNKVKKILAFNVMVSLLNLWTFLALAFLVGHPNLWIILACLIPLGLIDIFLLYHFFKLALKTRRELKHRFHITQDGFKGRTEAWMVFFCSCCAISQMGRHTADYSIFREDALSATGLPSHLETLVPLVSRHSCSDVGQDSGDSVHSC